MKTIGTDMAYPVNTSGNGFCEGLTKRELFAAMAMQGMLSSNGGWFVGDAVDAADALIAELNKEVQS